MNKLPTITRAYLDVESTGFSRRHHDLAVIGIAIETSDSTKTVQLVGNEITDTGLINALAGADVIYTYNGRCFDLPFIKHKLGVDLEQHFCHRDLRYDCRRHGFGGGLKTVEERFGITRQSKGIDGWAAVRLWQDYVSKHDVSALQMLLLYNREDVVNLKTIRETLGVE
jgi:uncharacterized protein YprB with RNaseH-like and TPR domain